MKTFRKVLLILLTVLFCAFAAMAGYYFFVTKDAKLSREKLLLPDTQIIVYDANGERLSGVLAFENRDTVALNDLPNFAAQAFVNTEDKRFYTHHGFDFIRIGKAFLKNLQSGSFKEGASTISQQLVKNTHLSLEKTVRRKLKEFKLTALLERNYTKAEILEMYLNTIYFGHSCYGIGSASDFYFGKSAETLTLPEAAMLAGLVKSPNNYSPFKNPEKCLARRKTVLSAMLAQKSISQAEYERACLAALPEAPKQNASRSYAHYAVEEFESIAEENDLPLSGKIELYTYLQPTAQRTLESVQEEASSDKTLAVIDNETHAVKAFFSTAGNIKRLPGSVIKPLLVYAPAFEEGILSPATPILDEAVNFSGYAPQNYDDQYHGYISAREAISKSLNIPAVKTLNSLTVNKAVAYAQKLGLPISEKDRSLALALGGMERGFSFFDILSAYTTFASDGRFMPCRFIKEIRRQGEIVYTRNDIAAHAFSPETAYLVTDTLKTAAQNGTAKKLRSLPFSVAAKTGTVGTKNGNTDAYTVAYTSLDTVGVWMGNTDNTPVDCTGGGTPCNFTKAILERIYDGKRVPDFEKPIGIQTTTLDKLAYENDHRVLLADEKSPAAFRLQELFNRSYLPRERSRVFSAPSIVSPAIKVENGGAIIYFKNPPPAFYEYAIERTGLDGTKTVYRGKAFTEFLDRDLDENARYVYQITPYYLDNRGKTITLPSVTTDGSASPPIADKPWWEY
ncbi:MAG: penicillin-binding protein [Clostridia bacterium]|nr:penicillin-binding protein [Clostridia bacterium]